MAIVTAAGGATSITSDCSTRLKVIIAIPQKAQTAIVAGMNQEAGYSIKSAAPMPQTAK
ncbi:unknown [Sutterella sp. CAG:351]|nr:unknown [Sutterella sp. CAG:351]